MAEAQQGNTKGYEYDASDDHIIDSVVLTADFVFVALDSKTGKAAPVNRLLHETVREKVRFKRAEARNQLSKSKIRSGEHKELALLIRDGATGLESWLRCQPQHRKMHGNVFVGFLMHTAFELAFSTAYAFAASVPCFLQVDQVDVGDFVRFKSCVLYTKHENNTDQPLINIEVVAHVTRPEEKFAEVSNTFYFTFTVPPEAKIMKNKFIIRN
ncbi:hypothetical protein L484_007417 [Morus notabilis]|uniref:HotDog ACOT-type domain-containing protein n=1 Tax=Morus notabilis TaxID=981085 RepID=W9QZL8_9ROSA|nr:hypothetical protein L484_007417 [Morus notabilis]